MIFVFYTGLIIPAIVTVLIPVALLLFILSLKPVASILEALGITAAFVTLVSVLLAIVDPIIPQVGQFIVSLSGIWYNVFVGLEVGVAYLILQALAGKKTILLDQKMWFIIGVVIAAKFIVPMIFPGVMTMSVI